MAAGHGLLRDHSWFLVEWNIASRLDIKGTKASATL
jgi:hypothetical protein